MAVRFGGDAAQQRITSFVFPTVVSGTPFTVAAWVRPQAVDINQTVVSFANAGSTTDYFALQGLSTNVWTFGTYATTKEDITAGTVTQNEWQFVVARSISTSNRRLSVLGADGSIVHAQGTTLLAPSGIDHIAIGRLGTAVSGPHDHMNGDVAEFWYTKTDVYPGGTAMDDEFLRQLAYGGPFSINWIAAELIEYHSFAGEEPAPIHHNGLYQWGTRGQIDHFNTNDAKSSPHVPLPASYVDIAEARGLASV